MSTITLAGKTYPVRPPKGGTGFACAEAWAAVEITEANALVAAAAAIGLCTEVSRLRLTDCGFSVVAYGAEVYGQLRQSGVTAAEIAAAAPVCYQLLAGLLAPREAEVAAKVDFSRGGGGSTPSPSSFP